MSASAFRASYSDWRLVKTRGVVQCVFEVPLADADKAYEVLGGMPNSSAERWFGIAALQQEAPGKDDRTHEPETASSRLPNRSFRDLPPAQQAGIRCEEPSFIAFLKEHRANDWHESADDPAACVRLICGVKSRADLANNHKARVMWTALNNQFEAWKQVENA